jgi:fructoselysine-6-P-deglycase FrlB-like protein/hydroxymethylpyrimidine pyrophosphatase-like HAD family hydrolase
MGRPYADELATLASTYTWALNLDLNHLMQSVKVLRSFPLIVVGSGGSLSVCTFVARLHETWARLPARVLTPLEFVCSPTLPASAVLLLSASGRNPDILAAADHAIESEHAAVVALCARTRTPLARTLASHRHAMVHEYIGPSPKDGFLATNSLLLTSTLLGRAYGASLPTAIPAIGSKEDCAASAQMSGSAGADSSDDRLVSEAQRRPFVIALASGWATAAAVDLESKWSELGFGSVTVTDSRNFAHGRHHGLSRRLNDTLVLGLATSDDPGLVDETLKRLPTEAHRALVRSPLAGEAGAIDLLMRVIKLTGAVGAAAGIDPGRPTVPSFGRALYHRGIPRSTLKTRGRRTAFGEAAHTPHPEDLWIQRKVSPVVWASATEEIREQWRTLCREWVTAAESQDVRGIVLDYDGTLCESSERFSKPALAIGEALAGLIDRGLQVGVATGRGDSVIEALRAVIPRSAWTQIIVGMYNGGVLSRLNEQPVLASETADAINRACTILTASPAIMATSQLRVRPTQLTVYPTKPLPKGLLHRFVLEALLVAEHLQVEVVTSDHTVDVTVQGISKQLVVDAVRSNLSRSPEAPLRTAIGHQDETCYPQIMTIGDQGQFGGNDASFLAHVLGLSVDHVSSSFIGCWNVAPSGARRTAAVLAYLRALQLDAVGSFRWSAACACDPKRASRGSIGLRAPSRQETPP